MNLSVANLRFDIYLYGILTATTIFSLGCSPAFDTRATSKAFSSLSSSAGPGASLANPTSGQSANKLCNVKHIKQTPAKRLNSREYINSIKSLFAINAVPALSLPKDEVGVDGFDTDASAIYIDSETAPTYLEAAQTVFANLKSANKLPFKSCQTLTDAMLRTCVQNELSAWLELAFRRPALPEEISIFTKLIAGYKQFADVVEVTVLATLVSPHFLFHYKSAPNAAGTIDQFELASKISFFLLAAPPTAELLDHAKKGTLQGEVLKANIDQMINDPRFLKQLERFVVQWLDLASLPQTDFGSENPKLVASMIKETQLSFKNAFLKDLPISDLLVQKESFIDAQLANLYGIAGAGTDFALTALPANRQGLLMQSSLLAVTSPDGKNTNPIHRGAWVADKVFCQKPPPAPPDAGDLSEPKPGELVTIRQQLEAHRTNPSCIACHQTFDQYGLALESYDGFGAWRGKYDNGLAVETHGSLPSGELFRDAIEMSSLIADKKTLDDCATKKLGSFALGRSLTNGEACYTQSVARTLNESSGKATVRSVVMQLILSDLYIQQGAQ